MTRKRNTFQTPRVLDEQRARRASGAASVGEAAGAGLSVDQSGRLSVVMGDAFYLDDRKRWQIRVGDGLALAPGSPKRLTVLLDGRSIVQLRDGKLAATPDLSDVKGTVSGIDADTLLGILTRLQANKLSVADAAITYQPIGAYQPAGSYAESGGPEGTLTWAQRPRWPCKTLTSGDSPYSVQGDDGVFLVDLSSGSVDVVLPDSADSANAGMEYIFKIVAIGGINVLTVTDSGSNQVDGSALGLVLSALLSSARLVSEKTTPAWWKVG